MIDLYIKLDVSRKPIEDLALRLAKLRRDAAIVSLVRDLRYRKINSAEYLAAKEVIEREYLEATDPTYRMAMDAVRRTWGIWYFHNPISGGGMGIDLTSLSTISQGCTRCGSGVRGEAFVESGYLYHAKCYRDKVHADQGYPHRCPQCSGEGGWDRSATLTCDGYPDKSAHREKCSLCEGRGYLKKKPVANTVTTWTRG